MTFVQSTLRAKLISTGLMCAAALCLAACAEVSTDPRAGGLAGGIKGLTTGAYDQRIDDKRTELADLERAEDRMRGRVAGARSELADLERRLAQRNSALQKMRAEIADIDRLISEINADAQTKRASISVVNSANSATQAKIDKIVSERDKLQLMTRELEENNRQEALLHQRLKKQKDGEAGQGVIVADIEKRANEADRRFADAGAQLGRLKAAARQFRL